MSGRKFDSLDTFIQKSNIIHHNKYDYSLTQYVRSSDKVIIICPTHGNFEVVANSHKLGFGCCKCGYEKMSQHKQLTQKDFIKNSIKVHGNLYDYSLVNYKGGKSQIKIICKTHGVFIKNAGAHLHEKQGCTFCSKNAFSSNLEKRNDQTAFLYIIKCIDINESFFKVGITSRAVEKRFNELPYKIEVLKIIENLPLEIIKLENKIKNLLFEFRYKPEKIFCGYTECFKTDINEINTILQPILK